MSRVLRLLPCLAWMAAIYYMSSRTGDDLGSWLPFFQKLLPGMHSFDWGHFFAYFGLALTYLIAIGKPNPGIPVKLIVILLCILYGITDEYHQSFVPGRTPDVLDLRNDAIGAALAMLFVSIPAVRRMYDAVASP